MKKVISALLFITLLVSSDLLIPATTEAIQADQSTMPLGTNFWNINWGDGRLEYFQDGVDWNTVENPWRQEFLDDIQIYSVLRFMDQVPTNSSDVRDWDQRTLPTENHYTTPGGAVAYEWQIDLCNRIDADMWITVPHLSIESYEDDPENNYWTELAALVKDRLNPGLNVYVEYSNETWSSGANFLQGDYVGQRGVDMGFDADFYTAKFYFHVYAATRLHKIFLDTFADNPDRIKTVVSGQDASTYGTEQIARAVDNQTLNNGEDTRLNPWNLEVDYFAAANYISSDNGAASDIRDAWSSDLAESVDRYQQHLDIIAPTGMQLISYEGGQHYTNNAHIFSQNPESYDMYMEWLNAVSDYFELTMHYTHLGTWSSGGAWGAKASTDQSIDDAHKYRALRDWVLGVDTEISEIFLSNDDVDEGQPAGTLVGIISTNVPNDGGFNYSIIGGDTERFSINGNELLTAGEFDFDIQESYETTIRVADPEDETNTLDKTFTITVLEIPEGEEVVLTSIADTDVQSDLDGTSPIVNVSEFNFMFNKYDLSDIDEVNAAKARVYFRSTGFDDTTHSLDIYRVSEDWNEDDAEENLPSATIWDGNGLIEGQTQQVSSAGYVEFDVTEYVQDRISEGLPTVSFGFRADVSGWQNYFARENGENMPELVLFTDESQSVITDIFLSETTVNEGLAAGALVGTLSTNMGDDEDFDYALVDEEIESFVIEDNELRTAEMFDFDIQDSYEITIRAADPEDETNTLDKTFTIAVIEVPEGEDRRIIASNRSEHIFSEEDFGMEEDEFSVKIESLPDEGSLLLDGNPIEEGEVILPGDFGAGQLRWDPPAGEYGYQYTSFDFSFMDPDFIPPPPPPPGTESPSGSENGEVFAMVIDLAAASVELTGGEGWRFLTSPATGETYTSLLDPLWTQGVPGSDNPGASSANILQFDQQTFWWTDVPGMDQSIGQGESFIAYVLSDEDNDGSSEGFPKTLTSLEEWAPLDGSFAYSGLAYDPDPEGANPDNLFLVANPHPISVDFCQMFDASTNLGSSNWIWNPAAGGGNGDYVNLNCATEEEVPVAPFQGFWVRTTDANPALGIPEEAYLGGPEEGFFKQNLQSEEPVHIVLDLHSEDEVFANKVNILFSEEGTLGMDRFDAPKLSPAGLADRWLSFYALDEQNRRYAFRSLPRDFDEKMSIPLDIETTDAGIFILDWSLPSSGGFPGSYWLRDNHADEVMELVNGQSYRFEVPDVVEKRPDSFSKPVRSKDGSSDPRFELIVAVGEAGPDEKNELPSETRLRQNYPNPFNPSTVIRYELPQTSDVRMDVFDLTGRRIATLVDRQVSAGHHQINFDAGSLSSGVYVYRLQAEGVVQTKKMILVK